jgi:hypothetical protein
MSRKCLPLVAMCALLSSCGLLDSGIEWRGGPYELGWIDLPNEVTLSYRLNGTSSVGRIEARVFAVGWDGHYIVAKQHPKGDKSITNYFIIDASKDGPFVDPPKIVQGPLSELDFVGMKRKLNLPEFTKELWSLK